MTRRYLATLRRQYLYASEDRSYLESLAASFWRKLRHSQTRKANLGNGMVPND